MSTRAWLRAYIHDYFPQFVQAHQQLLGSVSNNISPHAGDHLLINDQLIEKKGLLFLFVEHIRIELDSIQSAVDVRSFLLNLCK